mgnify:CR=1 FL=1
MTEDLQLGPRPDEPGAPIGNGATYPPDVTARLAADRFFKPENLTALRELALQRGLAVRDALIGSGLASDRLFLAAPKLHTSAAGDATWMPQVSLTLSSR